jgi:hypothetical protein
MMIQNEARSQGEVFEESQLKADDLIAHLERMGQHLDHDPMADGVKTGLKNDADDPS